MIALLAASAGVARAQNANKPPLSPELKRFADDCDLLGRGTVLKLEESLRGLRSGQVQTRNNAAAIRRAEADIAAIKSHTRVIVPTLRFPVSAGDVGRLPGTGAHVEQIWGPESMLIRGSFRMQVVVTRHYNRLAETVTRPVLFQIRGLATKQFSAGADAEMLQTFRVAGSHSYATSDGRTNTVLVLEPVDMQAIESYLRSKPGQ